MHLGTGSEMTLLFMQTAKEIKDERKYLATFWEQLV